MPDKFVEALFCETNCMIWKGDDVDFPAESDAEKKRNIIGNPDNVQEGTLVPIKRNCAFISVVAGDNGRIFPREVPIPCENTAGDTVVDAAQAVFCNAKRDRASFYEFRHLRILIRISSSQYKFAYIVKKSRCSSIILIDKARLFRQN